MLGGAIKQLSSLSKQIMFHLVEYKVIDISLYHHHNNKCSCDLSYHHLINRAPRAYQQQVYRLIYLKVSVKMLVSTDKIVIVSSYIFSAMLIITLLQICLFVHHSAVLSLAVRFDSG